MTGNPRSWAINASRDERIAGNPSGAHVASHRVKQPDSWSCIGCRCVSTSPALYCEACVMHTELRP